MLVAANSMFLLNPGQASSAEINLFFLHHSTGRYLLQEGTVRTQLETYNLSKSDEILLWDHDYNSFGLTDPSGTALGYDFAIPDDNTDPIGLHKLWTTNNSARDSILSRFDVVAFKSCYYPTNVITSDAQLETYKQYYREIVAELSQHPDVSFVLMSPPPMNPAGTSTDQADRARAFANWLATPDCLNGQANVHYFDYYTLMANPDDGSATRNMMRDEYQRSTTDWHPNALANETVAPLFLDFMIVVANGSPASAALDLPQPIQLEQNFPNPFNPSTTISFDLSEAALTSGSIMDLRGHEIRTFPTLSLDAGQHSWIWDGRDDQGTSVSSGSYLFQLTSETYRRTIKMTLSR